MPCVRLCLGIVAATLLVAPVTSAVTMDWVTVGSPGNAADTEVMTCCNASTGTTGYGSVASEYRISKYEVTNSQYAEFLNEKAVSDAQSLYDSQMGSSIHGGITRSGSDGSYSYSVKGGFESKPVVLVSFYNALRFSNWMHNGQGSGDTETGAYSITFAGISNNSITRNIAAQFFLPTEDEWYKAAYFDSVSSGFFDYAGSSDSPMTCDFPTGDTNAGNCSTASGTWIVGSVADSGSYPGSASPSGTFDQGGNAWEWVETATSSTARGVRGGSFHENSDWTAASHRNNDFQPEWHSWDVGFRLGATVPEPNTALLLGVGLAGLGMRRRQRTHWRGC